MVSLSQTSMNTSAQLLSFFVGEFECAFEIEYLKEIVWIVEITKVPMAPHFIEGIINARGHAISVGNMRKLFRIPQEDFKSDTQIIISEISGHEIGFIVDSSKEILYVNREDILPPNQTLPMAEFLKGVVGVEGRLVLLLDIMKILTYKSTITSDAPADAHSDSPVFRSSVKDAYGDEVVDKSGLRKIIQQRTAALAQRTDLIKEEKRELLVIRLGSEWYGIRIEDVREVFEPVSPTLIPYSPHYIEGVINVRGDVYAVVNIKRLLEFSEGPASELTVFLVMDIPGMKISIPVDEVRGMESIAEKDIVPPLLSIKKVRVDYLEGEVKWDNKLLGILNIKNVAKALKSSAG